MVKWSNNGLLNDLIFFLRN